MTKGARIFFAMFLIGALSAGRAEATTLTVVTTVAPLADMVTRVAGNRATVTGLVPEGVNSHTFEPAPSHAKALAGADLIIVNGLHLETPTVKLAEKVKHARTPILFLGDKTLAPADWKFDFSFPQSAGHPNPHLWPNIAFSLRYVEHIRDALAALSPGDAKTFQANAAAYGAELRRLDAAIFACIATIPIKNRKLVTYHDSFAYFAPRYGMTVIGAVQPADFAEPSPKEVARMITQLRTENVPAIFGSEVFPSPVLEQIAKEARTAYIDQLRDDDLPGAVGDKHHSFIGMMASNLRIMTENLGGNPACMAGIDD